jgi:hypothetical protein
VETSTASTSKTYPKQTEVVAYPYITSTASSNSKPHSFPEAETPIPRPPFAQKRSRTGCLVPCAALFTHSCQNHFLTPLPAYGGFNLALVLTCPARLGVAEGEAGSKVEGVPSKDW